MLVLPDVRQKKDYDCGRAAVECVLQFFGSYADLRRLLTNPMDGTDPRAIEALLRKAGHHVVSGEMTLDDLRHFTRSRRPVIAVVNGHYVVVGGVDWSRGWKIGYQDPCHGFMKAKWVDFQGWWKEADRLGVTYNQFGIAVS